VRSLSPLVGFLSCTLALAGCGGSKHTAAAPPPVATNASGCRQVPQPAAKGPQHLPKPTLRLDPAKRYELAVQTNCGNFTIRLDPAHHPKTAASMYSLARQGFYDGLTFHRIAAGFVIQGGDPLGNGQGGPGYTVVEAPRSGDTYPRGTIAMAKTQSEPNGASGSQFFVVTGEDATQTLQGQYAIAGRVVAGEDVVDRIGTLPVKQDPADPNSSPPVDPVVMTRVVAKGP
jgi:cyclophilin family peptidyl-prolyl cis-trans isomerase